MRRHNAWLAPVPLVIALGLAVGSAMTLQESETFDEAGVHADGVVLQTERRRERVSGERVRRYYVTYLFELADGGEQRNRDRVSRRFHDSVAEGDRIAVTYLPDDPGTAEIDPEGTNRTAMILALASLGTGGFGVWLMRRYWRRCASMHRAIKRGVAQPARVTGRTNSVPAAQGQPTWRLDWSDTHGRKGRSLPRKLEDLEPWPQGSEITIHLDPKTDTAWWDEDILRPKA